MLRWYRPMHRIAIVLAAIVIIVYAIEAAAAISQGRIVVGWNAWHQPLFAVMQLVVAIVAGPTLLWWAVRHWNDTGPPVKKDE
jgi:hypothetical protein